MDSITDVQRAAIQGLLQLKGYSLTDLSAKALGHSITSLEELSHQEAVEIIKYGIVQR